MATFSFGGSGLVGAKKKPAYAGAPIINSSGLITGYEGAGAPVTAGALKPVYNARGLVTDYSNGTGLDISPSGGAAGDGGSPEVGIATSATRPGNQNADFSLLNQTKNPAIAGAAADLLGQVKTGPKDFQQYLDEAKQQIEQNKSQLEQDKKAFDVGPLEGKLATYDKNFVDTMGGLDNKYSGLINDYRDAQQGQVGALQDELRNYETSSQAVADRALEYAQKRNSLYQAGSGTPTSDSGDMRQRAIQAFLDVNLPLQKELSAARQNLITNVQMPLNREVQGQSINQLTGFEAPLASTTANLFGGDAKYVASLRAQLAGRSMQESLQYMQSLGIPIQMQQQVLQGSLGLLGGLTGIDQQNTFYGLSSPYSPEITGIPDYTGAFNYGGRRTGVLPVAPSVQAGSGVLPRTVNPGVAAPIVPRAPVGNGINLPNDYAFGRTAGDQAYYLAVQNALENGYPVPPRPQFTQVGMTPDYMAYDPSTESGFAYN